MDNRAVENILRIANEILPEEPEMAKSIVTNLRGLVEESRVASAKITVDDLEKCHDLSGCKALVGKLLGHSSDPKDHDASGPSSESMDSVAKFLLKCKNEIGDDPDMIKLLVSGLNGAKDADAITEACNAALEGISRSASAMSTKVTVATLVRVAFEHPETRSVLLPIIAAKSKKKPKVEAVKKPAKKASPKKASPKKASPKKHSMKSSPKETMKANKNPAKKPSKRKASVQVSLSDSQW